MLNNDNQAKRINAELCGKGSPSPPYNRAYLECTSFLPSAAIGMAYSLATNE